MSHFAPLAMMVALSTACARLLTPLYGHYAYVEASRATLVSVGNGERMQRDAAAAFLRMQAAARRDGVTLTAISGFRTYAQQHSLFYDVARQRGQTLAQRALVSAPPGHSQHATGYAVDIDSLDQSFDQTRAFAWLKAHAAAYAFRISFPKHNAQGVSYEPWHWSWHGSAAARKALHDECAR